MNFNKKGLAKSLDILLKKKTQPLVLTHQDRLLRFGFEGVFTLCEPQGIVTITPRLISPT